MALTYLGDTCFGLQDFPPARTAYQRSLAVYPNGRLADRAKYGLARTLAALGERDKALSLMQELAKAAKPEWVDRAWLQIGLIRKSDGRLAEAAEAFATLERVAPKSCATARSPASARACIAATQPWRGGRALIASPGERCIGSVGRAGGPGAGDYRAGTQSVGVSADHSRVRAQAVSGLDVAAGDAVSSRRGPPGAKPPGRGSQARFEKVADGNPNDPWADDALERAARAALARGDLKGAARLAGSFAARISPRARSRLRCAVDRGPARLPPRGNTTRWSRCSNRSLTLAPQPRNRRCPRCSQN